MKSENIVINFTIPKEFLEDFDRETRGLYQSRYEAIREAMRMLLRKLKAYKARQAQEAIAKPREDG